MFRRLGRAEYGFHSILKTFRCFLAFYEFLFHVQSLSHKKANRMIDEQNTHEKKPDTPNSLPSGNSQDQTVKESEAQPNANHAANKLSIRERFSAWRIRRRDAWQHTPVHDRANVRATRIIAGATVLYTIFAGWTLKKLGDSNRAAQSAASAAKESADHAKDANDFARDSLYRVQRALIIVNQNPEVKVVMDPSGQQKLELDFFIENSGTTPTRKLKAHINLRDGSPLPENFDFPDAPDKYGRTNDAVPVIGPKDKFPFVIEIRKERIESLQRGQTHMYVYGWVSYNDIFDGTPSHLTRFSFELVSKGMVRLQNGQSGEGMQTVITGTRFNCYDEQCEEQTHQ